MTPKELHTVIELAKIPSIKHALFFTIIKKQWQLIKHQLIAKNVWSEQLEKFDSTFSYKGDIQDEIKAFFDDVNKF